MYVDFHTHTLASDGQLTPTELVKKAKQLGFSFIAKTDHDNVNLMPEFLAAGKKFSVHTIPGIEISSRYLNKSLHIAALGIDYRHPKIIAYAQKCIAARKIRGLKMAAKLARAGWQLKKSELDRVLLARPHVALAVINHPQNKKRLLQEFGAIPDFSTFIRKYLAKGCSCYAPKKYYIKPLPAINMIHASGGLAIIAHPLCQTKEFSYSRPHLLKIVKTLPFDGLEVYNNGNGDSDIDYLKSLAKKHHLLVSAGSDYHGYDKEFPLGITYHGQLIKEATCADLIKRLT